jgi:hypothetical protein
MEREQLLILQQAQEITPEGGLWSLTIEITLHNKNIKTI